MCTYTKLGMSFIVFVVMVFFVVFSRGHCCSSQFVPWPNRLFENMMVAFSFRSSLLLRDSIKCEVYSIVLLRPLCFLNGAEIYGAFERPAW